jgi:hypothetical protein
LSLVDLDRVLPSRLAPVQKVCRPTSVSKQRNLGSSKKPEGSTVNNLIAAAVILMAATTISLAGEEEVHGTWKLVSEQRTIVETGETLDLNPGVSPSGYITYGGDGRMIALIVGGTRPKPESVDKMTDQQRAGLFRSMVAYGGTYKFEGGTMEHHIDISWNEVWTGTTQIREVRRDGDRLIYRGRPAPFSGDGKMSVVTLIWERVK